MDVYVIREKETRRVETVDRKNRKRDEKERGAAKSLMRIRFTTRSLV